MDEFSEKLQVGGAVNSNLNYFIADKVENHALELPERFAIYFPEREAGGRFKGRSEFLRNFIHICGYRGP